MRILFLVLFFMTAWVVNSAAQTVRVDTTKQFNHKNFSDELEVITGLTFIPLQFVAGSYVETPDNQVTVAELQQAVDNHVFVALPPPKNFTQEYINRRTTIPAGPIREMFDLLAERLDILE